MKNYLDTFNTLKTPFYWYDMDLLDRTLISVKQEADKYGFHVHYAVKANANLPILEKIREYGFGTDCVSGNEVLRSLEAGFKPKEIAFAGVGKTDEEIAIGIENDIFSFNVESIPELEVINEIAAKLGKSTNVSLRLNPNVAANTHEYITTGLNENKFGINMMDMEEVLNVLATLSHIKLTGIHFHIGSQITDLNDFKKLCERINQIQDWFEEQDIKLEHINAGGGLGIDYQNPDENSVPDFESYFKVFAEHLKLRPNQQLHFELGRSIVGQCGSLLTKVLYVKKGVQKQFAIVDAGFTELIRPALYQAYHEIENISSTLPEEKYDVVGPICESTDFFRKDVTLAGTKRNDIIAIKSAGAYGQVMTSQYNLRTPVKAYYSDKQNK
ncbi:diaminopimelate decarboxylase [Maribellus sediminis]|uniref:diaminopimelate decarboxylase n=1 Tax=Maribellus sediminis TaxID=2696285 RepID=UPI0014319016|nr:diaminopimelate decarboxylase [Maribellus sediminis]